jgi:hypothetical protein
VDLDIACEFYENGRTIDLISLAIVAPDGEFFYAINQNMPFGPICNHPYLMEHVMPSLPVRLGYANPWDADHPDFQFLMPCSFIAEGVRRFITRYEDPCLWADYGAYNHVVMAQLWGRMQDYPAGLPMWTANTQQEIRRLGSPAVPALVGEAPTALRKARHNQSVRSFLRDYEKEIHDGCR